ncbi:MAG: hypothetical protein ACT4TC_10820 [Myxococcaceae bacterium]
MRAGTAYKVSPEQAVLGKLEPDPKAAKLSLGNVERDVQYAYLLSLIAPPAGVGRRVLAKVSFSFDAPAFKLRGQKIEREVVVEYTKGRTGEPNAEVRDAFRGVQFVELVEGLAEHASASTACRNPERSGTRAGASGCARVGERSPQGGEREAALLGEAGRQQLARQVTVHRPAQSVGRIGARRHGVAGRRALAANEAQRHDEAKHCEGKPAHQYFTQTSSFACNEVSVETPSVVVINAAVLGLAL